MGEELAGEHEIAEGGEELTGAPAVRAVPEKDGFHGSIGPVEEAIAIRSLFINAFDYK